MFTRIFAWLTLILVKFVDYIMLLWGAIMGLTHGSEDIATKTLEKAINFTDLSGIFTNPNGSILEVFKGTRSFAVAGNFAFGAVDGSQLFIIVILFSIFLTIAFGLVGIIKGILAYKSEDRESMHPVKILGKMIYSLFLMIFILIFVFFLLTTSTSLTGLIAKTFVDDSKGLGYSILSTGDINDTNAWAGDGMVHLETRFESGEASESMFLVAPFWANEYNWTIDTKKEPRGSYGRSYDTGEKYIFYRDRYITKLIEDKEKLKDADNKYLGLYESNLGDFVKKYNYMPYIHSEKEDAYNYFKGDKKISECSVGNALVNRISDEDMVYNQYLADETKGSNEINDTYDISAKRSLKVFYINDEKNPRYVFGLRNILLNETGNVGDGSGPVNKSYTWLLDSAFDRITDTNNFDNKDYIFITIYLNKYIKKDAGYSTTFTQDDFYDKSNVIVASSGTEDIYKLAVKIEGRVIKEEVVGGTTTYSWDNNESEAFVLPYFNYMDFLQEISFEERLDIKQVPDPENPGSFKNEVDKKTTKVILTPFTTLETPPVSFLTDLTFDQVWGKVSGGNSRLTDKVQEALFFAKSKNYKPGIFNLKDNNYSFIIPIVVSLVVLWIIGKNLIGLIIRVIFIYVNTIFFGPVACAKFPLDDGEAFKKWKDKVVSHAFYTVSAILSLGVFTSLIGQTSNFVEAIGFREKGTVVSTLLKCVYILACAISIPALQKMFDNIFGLDSSDISESAGKLQKGMAIAGAIGARGAVALGRKAVGVGAGAIAGARGTMALMRGGATFGQAFKNRKNEKIVGAYGKGRYADKMGNKGHITRSTRKMAETISAKRKNAESSMETLGQKGAVGTVKGKVALENVNKGGGLAHSLARNQVKNLRKDGYLERGDKKSVKASLLKEQGLDKMTRTQRNKKIKNLYGSKKALAFTINSRLKQKGKDNYNKKHGIDVSDKK